MNNFLSFSFVALFLTIIAIPNTNAQFKHLKNKIGTKKNDLTPDNRAGVLKLMNEEAHYAFKDAQKQLKRLEKALKDGKKGEINYTRFILKTGEKLMASKTLKKYENLLTNYGFYRIHQSSLINLRYVKEYIKGEGGEVVMINNDQLDVSRRRKSQFVATSNRRPIHLTSNPQNDFRPVWTIE
ncbi:MAG: LytR/AlgR family response regulator transcription factor [Saprospiraceae bacterium]